jgi:epoxyqueuosine reductase
MTPLAKAQLVKDVAREVGFDRVGLTHAGPVERAQYYKLWLAAGYGGAMEYLWRNVALREEPGRLLPGARSVICAALSYNRGPASAPDPGRRSGRVAMYAQGRDYHAVLRGMLHDLVECLRERFQERFEARLCVDTAPVLERALAAAAGLGWIGKNTCLLHHRLGSYLLLGEVITTIELAPDGPATDHCGTCRRCLDACPTSAFPEPYKLNASRCISHFTIEHRGEIPKEFHAGIGDWVCGCDVCQQVCPYNRRAPRATHPDVTAARTPAQVDLIATLKLNPAEHRRLTDGSASRRARRNMWRRNAAIALGNATNLDESTAAEVEAALREAAEDGDPLVADAARHALRRRMGDRAG